VLSGKMSEIKRLSDNRTSISLPEAFAPFPDYLTFGVLPNIYGSNDFDQMVNDFL